MISLGSIVEAGVLQMEIISICSTDTDNHSSQHNNMIKLSKYTQHIQTQQINEKVQIAAADSAVYYTVVY
jgi:hypothetical protein